MYYKNKYFGFKFQSKKVKLPAAMAALHQTAQPCKNLNLTKRTKEEMNSKQQHLLSFFIT